MTHLLVTGASGLLGLNLSLLAVAQGFKVTGWVHTRGLKYAPFSIQRVDLCELDSIAARITEIKPDLIIHCAALANLEAAEADPGLAQRLNSDAAGRLAQIAAERQINLVHISTDAVFNGQRGDYTEEDEPSPLGVYAQSKLAGELAVREANPSAIIARVNFYGWSLSGERSLAEFFFNNLQAGNPIKGFTDVLFCPLYVAQLADILLEMVVKKLYGVYHVLSAESLSKYAFGLAIARRFGFNENLITPISVQNADLLAPRSPNLTLKVDKLQNDLGHALPKQVEGLEAFYQAYQNDIPNQLRACL